MMVLELLRVVLEHPLLTVVFLVDVILVLMIVSYVAMRVFGTRRPDRILAVFFSKFFVKLHEGSMQTIDSLYEFVIRTYSRKGVVSRLDGKGLKAREKVLATAKDDELAIVTQIFDAYESKLYGGGVVNEEKAVGYLLDKFRAV